MTKLRTALLGAAALGALALGTPAANATFYVFYSTDGGTTYTAFPGSPGTDSGTLTQAPFTAGNITFNQASFTNNAPGTPASSFTATSQLNASSANGGSVKFAIVDNNFTSPITSANLTNSVSYTGGNLTGPNNTLSQVSCVFSGAATPTTGTVNNLCATPGATTTAAATTTTTNQLSGSASTAAPVASLSSPFTIAEFFTLTLGAGNALDATGRTSVAGTAVPEPVSMSLLAVGLIGLGAAGIRRKV